MWCCLPISALRVEFDKEGEIFLISVEFIGKLGYTPPYSFPRVVSQESEWWHDMDLHCPNYSGKEQMCCQFPDNEGS
jgi:hypothetical protein